MAVPYCRVYAMLDDVYSQRLPELAPTVRRHVAKLVCALVEAGCCTLPALAAAMRRLGLSQATRESTEVAIRRVLSDPRLTWDSAYAPLVRQVLAHWPAPVLICILDCTPLKDRLVRVECGVAYQGRTLPLAWRCYPASGITPPQTFQTLCAAVLDEACAVLPHDQPVLVLLDRGLCSPALWDAVCLRDLHPVLRALRTVRLRTADGCEQALGALLAVDDELVTCTGQVFKKAGWRAASVTAVRRAGVAEGWLLLSDLPADEQRALEYTLRMHIEEGFRDDKRQGWQWEQSRITRLDRAERLLLILHLATLWCLSVGSIAVQSGIAARWIRLRRPAWSLFRLGWHWLREAFAHGDLIPLHHRLAFLPLWPTALYTTSPP